MKRKVFHRLSFAVPVLCLFAVSRVYAQKQISSIQEYRITSGQTQAIGGVNYSEPDIYYTQAAGGKYVANRLTVQPTNQTAAVTAPYLNVATATSVQVNWKTSANASGSVVRFGLAADNLTETRTCTSSTQLSNTYYWNTVCLDQLQPNTVYFYQVVSNNVTSEVYRFRTMPTSDDTSKFRMLLVGDHQRNERSDYEWLLRMAKRKLDEKYGEAPIEDHVHFLLNVGDQVDEAKLSQYESAHLYKSREVMSHLPIMTAVGNHELKTAWNGSQDWDEGVRLYNGHYSSYGNIDYRGIQSGTANYYAYQAGRVLFVVLNSDETTADQKMWVRRVAAAAEIDPTVDFIVSLQHRPLYAEQYSDDTSPWTLNEIMPILSATGKHVINCAGHHHLYARGQLTDWPVYHTISGGGVGTSASGYEQLWGNTPNNVNRPEVQKTIDQWTYQIFEFDSAQKEMTVETYSIGNSRLGIDNECIDQFSIQLNASSTLATPTLTVNNLKITQEGTTNNIHSAEYQIARDAGFSDIVIDRILLKEDYYDVDNQKKPKNQGVNVGTLQLSNNDLANGTYYVRVRNRNDNLQWSEYSASRSFTVTASTQPTLTLDKQIYRTGETITCTFTGATGAKDWIGIYEHGKTPGGNGVTSKAWAYTGNATNGTLTFTIDDKNEYFAVLLANDGFTPMTDRVPLLVTNSPSSSNPFSMTTNKKVYNVGEPVVVSLANAPRMEKDWIGLYEKGVVPGGSIFSSSWKYVENNNSIQLNAEGSYNNDYNGPKPVIDGVYFIGYFQCDAYSEFFSRAEFVVGQPVVLNATNSVYIGNQPVGIVFEGAPGWDTDVLRVYNANNQLVQSISLGGQTGGRVLVENLTEGAYTAVVTTTTNNTTISNQIAFTVTNPVVDENGNSTFTAGENIPTIVVNYTAKVGWNTIVLPFAVSNLSIFGSNVKAYVFDDYSEDGLDFKIVNSLAAATPYVLYVETLSENNGHFIFNNVTISSADANTANWSTTKNGATFQGTYEPVVAPGMEGKYGVVPSTGRIQKGGANATLKGLRAYFELPTGVDGAKMNYNDDIVNAINGVSILNNSDENGVYDLQGRKLNTNNLPAGIYIKNGKKYIVK